MTQHETKPFAPEPSAFTLSLRRQYAVAKRRGYNQAVRRLRDLAPYSKDPAQVIACADLLATIGPDLPLEASQPEPMTASVPHADVIAQSAQDRP